MTCPYDMVVFTALSPAWSAVLTTLISVNLALNAYTTYRGLQGDPHTIYDVRTSTAATVSHHGARFDVSKDGGVLLSVDAEHGLRLLSPTNVTANGTHQLSFCGRDASANVTAPCVTLRAPATLTHGSAYTLPLAPPPVNGYILYGDPSGATWWATPPADTPGAGETLVQGDDIQIGLDLWGSTVHLLGTSVYLNGVNMVVQSQSVGSVTHLTVDSDLNVTFSRVEAAGPISSTTVTFGNPLIFAEVRCTLYRKSQVVTMQCPIFTTVSNPAIGLVGYIPPLYAPRRATVMKVHGAYMHGHFDIFTNGTVAMASTDPYWGKGSPGSLLMLNASGGWFASQQ